MEEIGKSLPGILRGYLRRERPLVVEILAPLWLRVAGASIAQHSRPVAFCAGTLTVEATSEVWAAQLRHIGEEIRAEINASLGFSVVKRLVVREPRRFEPGGMGISKSGSGGRGVHRRFEV